MGLLDAWLRRGARPGSPAAHAGGSLCPGRGRAHPKHHRGAPRLFIQPTPQHQCLAHRAASGQHAGTGSGRAGEAGSGCWTTATSLGGPRLSSGPAYAPYRYPTLMTFCTRCCFSSFNPKHLAYNPPHTILMPSAPPLLLQFLKP